MFIETIDIATPFFQRPPSALLLKIAFEPSKVPDRGWVLLFNCLLSTHISLQEPQNLQLNNNLRRNVWLALDSSSLFLEPSLIKIQALYAASNARPRVFDTWPLLDSAQPCLPDVPGFGLANSTETKLWGARCDNLRARAKAIHVLGFVCDGQDALSRFRPAPIFDRTIVRRSTFPTPETTE